MTACKFCAFYRAPKHEEGWTHSLEEILRRCGEAVDLGATQIMLQGGHSPELGIEWYEQTFAAIKREYPQLVLHSLGASEVVHISRTSDLDFATVISRLQGGRARLIRRRRRGDPGRSSPDRDRSAEGVGRDLAAGDGDRARPRSGIDGHVHDGTGETNAERIEHLRMIRDVQDRTGGFRSFIPWTYQPENNHLRGRTQATSLEYLRMVAVARLFFDNINHLQGSWLTTGKDIGQLTLHFGADDLGSVMLEENVVSSAGARHRSNRTELIELIRGAGASRPSATRSTGTWSCTTTRPNDPVDERVHSHFSSTAITLLPVAAASLTRAARRDRTPRWRMMRGRALRF